MAHLSTRIDCIWSHLHERKYKIYNRVLSNRSNYLHMTCVDRAMSSVTLYHVEEDGQLQCDDWEGASELLDMLCGISWRYCPRKSAGIFWKTKFERKELRMDWGGQGMEWGSYPERSRCHEKKEYNEGIAAGDTRGSIWILRFWRFGITILLRIWRRMREWATRSL